MSAGVMDRDIGNGRGVGMNQLMGRIMSVGLVKRDAVDNGRGVGISRWMGWVMSVLVVRRRDRRKMAAVGLGWHRAAIADGERQQLGGLHEFTLS